MSQVLVARDSLNNPVRFSSDTVRLTRHRSGRYVPHATGAGVGSAYVIVSTQANPLSRRHFRFPLDSLTVFRYVVIEENRAAFCSPVGLRVCARCSSAQSCAVCLCSLA
jgi:hypothetical protein